MGNILDIKTSGAQEKMGRLERLEKAKRLADPASKMADCVMADRCGNFILPRKSSVRWQIAARSCSQKKISRIGQPSEAIFEVTR